MCCSKFPCCAHFRDIMCAAVGGLFKNTHTTRDDTIYYTHTRRDETRRHEELTEEERQKRVEEERKKDDAEREKDAEDAGDMKPRHSHNPMPHMRWL